jgi:group I intron endonuclease
MAIIYKITSPENKHYVGTTVQDLNLRIAQHKYKCNVDKKLYLYKKMRKFGFDKFKFSIIEKCSDDARFEREGFWIKKLRSFKNGYNKSEGGLGPKGFKPTKQQLEFASKQMKKLHKDPNFVKRLRAITQDSEVQRLKGIKGAYARMMSQPLFSVYDNGEYIGDFRTGVELAKKLNISPSTGCRYLNGKIGCKRFTFVRKEG